MLRRWVLFIGIAVCLLACSNGIEYSSNQNNDKHDLFSFSIKTSASPNQVNFIELKEMGKNFKDINENKTFPAFYSFRIYYGEYGSILEEYKEYVQFDLSTVDYFDIQWSNDSLVSINVIRIKDDGSTFKAESIDLDISDSSYK
ncbi:hypothetical protein [Solibacillus isronensis]|uniref:hypothetical protein n=1 Tax=Solibacillus isronensis TaxID=412383 RepID=UPI002041729C|nr:hypothetical protein [Solibacillus isronensis]MCM3721173.1 hypothetical protein [Solibacillus isronensis]